MAEEVREALIAKHIMGTPIAPVALHAPNDCAFLGVRQRRDGVLEIIYNRFGVRRSIWEITAGSVGIAGLQEACRRAINADDCLAVLYAALAAQGVRIECVEDMYGDRL